jgi:hypothetical protein
MGEGDEPDILESLFSTSMRFSVRRCGAGCQDFDFLTVLEERVGDEDGVELLFSSEGLIAPDILEAFDCSDKFLRLSEATIGAVGAERLAMNSGIHSIDDSTAMGATVGWTVWTLRAGS